MTCHPVSSVPESGGALYHRAGNFAVLAFAISFPLLGICFRIAADLSEPAAAILRFVPKLVFYSAILCGLAALCGIPRHGKSGLLWKGIVGGVVPLLLVAFFYYIVIDMRASLPKPEAIHFADIDLAKADAAHLIEKFKMQLGKEGQPVYVVHEDLPDSLKISPGVYGFVYLDHVSLVLHSNPEFLLGARVWIDGATPPMRDKPTKYESVTFFDVDKNLPKVGENRL